MTNNEGKPLDNNILNFIITQLINFVTDSNRMN